MIHHAARDLSDLHDALKHEHEGSKCPPECEDITDKARVMKLLEKAGADSKTTYRGMKTIRYAIRNQSIEVIKYLVSRDPGFNVADAWGDRPLHIACDYGFDDVVDFLLEQASVLETINDASDTLGTPLYIASYEGHVSLGEKILKAGAEIDILPTGNALGPVLYAACANNHGDIVRILLLQGANPEVAGPRYKSALEVAAVFEQPAIMHALENWSRWAVTGEPTNERMDVEESIVQEPTTEETDSNDGSFLELTPEPLPFTFNSIAERLDRRPLRWDEIDIGYEGNPFQIRDAT